jgi:hypothetical protein
MLLITIDVELRMVARRSQMRAGRPHAASGRPMLCLTCHARCESNMASSSYYALQLWESFGLLNDDESNMAALCKSNVKDTN